MQEITISNFVINSHALGQFFSYFLKVKMVNKANIMQPLSRTSRSIETHTELLMRDSREARFTLSLASMSISSLYGDS